MAAKRLFGDTKSCLDQDYQPPEKRTKPRPTFASIIGEVVMVNSLTHLSKALEPLLRKVVNEEVERCLMRYSRSITRSSSLRIQALQPYSYNLIFSNKLSLPIFTGGKITDVQANQLQLLVVDTTSGAPVTNLPPSIKVELVVLDGDFPSGDRDDWTLEDFNANIVKERTGRRPLLHGDINITLRHGAATIGDIEFTDNSSWIRSRKFRLGARLVSDSNKRDQDRWIREAITEPFVVRDHRGELYKKHYPPMLHDEVWRLEKIGKEGVFHRKLSKEKVNTVQDFLKLSIIDQDRLRKILGVGMSDRMWEATIKHARTCELGNKLYIYKGINFTLFLNPVCEIVRAIYNNQLISPRELSTFSKNILKNLIQDAYDNWHTVEEMEGNSNETLLLTQGNESYGNEEGYNGYNEVECIGDWNNTNPYISSSTTFQEGFRNYHY